MKHGRYATNAKNTKRTQVFASFYAVMVQVVGLERVRRKSITTAYSLNYRLKTIKIHF